jgi:HAD superfamily hydrolase (TIGR01484 family)
MDVKLVALDIDGTIIPPHTPPGRAYPSPRLRRAVRVLRERGVVVVLASGRMFPGTLEIAHHFDLDTPLICQQGCSVHRLDGTMLHEFPIERRTALEIVDYGRQLDRPYEWFNPVRYIASCENPASEEYARVSGITAEYRPDPENAGVSPTGVGIISDQEEASRIHGHLAGLHGDALHLLDFPTVTVAVAPEANKGHALSLLCTDLDIDRKAVLAVGDSVNDAAMLAWAGRGVAMAHSDRYARDAADEVLPANGDADPLATLLEGLARMR